MDIKKKRIRTVVKYRKPTLWVVLAAVAVCGVAAICFLTNPKEETQETASAPAPEPLADAVTQPPAVQVLSEPGMKLRPSAFEWHWENGMRSQDGIHPLLQERKTELPVFRRQRYEVEESAENEPVTLRFQSAPDDVRVYRWSDAYWETGKARAEEVPFVLPYDTVLRLYLRPGGYVYEVVADWKEDPAGYGTVCYWFYGVLGWSDYDGIEGLPYQSTLSWVSTDPADYGITGAMLRAIELPDFSSMPLEALGAYYLHTDGAGAEGAAYYLHQWFMEYPDSVLIYLEWIQGQSTEYPFAPENTAERGIIRAIAVEAKCGGQKEAFEALLRQCRAVYPTGSYAQLVEELFAQAQ